MYQPSLDPDFDPPCRLSYSQRERTAARERACEPLLLRPPVRAVCGAARGRRRHVSRVGERRGLCVSRVGGRHVSVEVRGSKPCTQPWTQTQNITRSKGIFPGDRGAIWFGFDEIPSNPISGTSGAWRRRTDSSGSCSSRGPAARRSLAPTPTAAKCCARASASSSVVRCVPVW